MPEFRVSQDVLVFDYSAYRWTSGWRVVEVLDFGVRVSRSGIVLTMPRSVVRRRLRRVRARAR